MSGPARAAKACFVLTPAAFHAGRRRAENRPANFCAVCKSRNGKYLGRRAKRPRPVSTARTGKFIPRRTACRPAPFARSPKMSNSNLWIGTDGGGVFYLRDGKIFSANAPVKDISCLWSDRDGTLWAGTSGHGLARLAQNRWTTYSASDGLAGDDVGYLIEDNFTNLWLGSYEGLMRVEEKSLADFASGAAKKISCRTFLTRECSAGAQPSAIRTRDGRLLFPTIEGLVAVNPADLRPNTNPPPIVIESVLVDGVRQKRQRFDSGGGGRRHRRSAKRTIGNSFHRTDFFRAERRPVRRAVQISTRRPRQKLDRRWRRTRGAFWPARAGQLHFPRHRLQRGWRVERRRRVAGGHRPAAVLAQIVVHRLERAGFSRRAGGNDLSRFHREIETPVAPRAAEGNDRTRARPHRPRFARPAWRESHAGHAARRNGRGRQGTARRNRAARAADLRRRRARPRARSTKLSGPSIRPTTRSRASPTTPANTRRIILRWPA